MEARFVTAFEMARSGEAKEMAALELLPTEESGRELHAAPPRQIAAPKFTFARKLLFPRLDMKTREGKSLSPPPWLEHRDEAAAVDELERRGALVSRDGQLIVAETNEPLYMMIEAFTLHVWCHVEDASVLGMANQAGRHVLVKGFEVLDLPAEEGRWQVCVCVCACVCTRSGKCVCNVCV